MSLLFPIPKVGIMMRLLGCFRLVLSSSSVPFFSFKILERSNLNLQGWESYFGIITLELLHIQVLQLHQLCWMVLSEQSSQGVRGTRILVRELTVKIPFLLSVLNWQVLLWQKNTPAAPAAPFVFPFFVVNHRSLNGSQWAIYFPWGD